MAELVAAHGEELDAGQAVRVNHVSSSCAGSSKSMLIRRNEDGATINVKCFRCGGYGIYSTKATLKSKIFGGASTGSGEGNERELQVSTGRDEAVERYNLLSRGGVRNVEEWSPKARLWINKYGLTDKEIQDNGIFYSNDDRRIILPVYGADDVQSYQTRKVYDEDTRPKYLSYTITSGIHLIPARSGRTDSICLVEDTISGIKCSRYVDTLVLHTTNLSQEHKKFLLKSKYDKHIIFLDDDNLTVKKNTLRIKKWLDKFSYTKLVQSGGRDPKEHSDSELIEILLGE